MTEFQGFVRDLLDLATLKTIKGSGCLAQYETHIVRAVTGSRVLDRGNPHFDAIVTDASRIGVAQVGLRMQTYNGHHAADVAALASLVQLRNALAHDDEDKARALARVGIRPALGYVKASQAALDRHARALDRVMWDHLMTLFPNADPWSL